MQGARSINEHYHEQLVSLKREEDLGDSRCLEDLPTIWAANARVRDLRSLAVQQSIEKSERALIRVDDPFPLRDPVAGDDLERVPDLTVKVRVPGIDV